MSEIPPPSVPPPQPPGGGTYTPPPPPPPPLSGGPVGPASSDRTLMLVLSYLWFGAIIPLVMKKDDPEVQWHAKNGLMWAIAITAIDIIFIIIGKFFPLFSCLISFVPCLIFVGYIVLSIIAIMKALKGERMRLPVLSDFADKS
jgi:uncharacterized membrane protein